ncbi:MAG TPA: FtsW/RodA/SpoVE family cell cycle protein [Anaerolineaceae bacterium]|nr:FtsW/RodA/SpoVE family cell cycle protein [Anaerolineaceae bacterium]
MKLFPISGARQGQIRSRLMTLAAGFVLLYGLILTLAPAVRLQSWLVDYRWQHWLGVIVWLVGFAWLHRQINERLPESDPYLLPAAALLTGWGLLTIWRLNEAYGLRQTIWLAVSLGVFGGGLRLKSLFEILRRYKYLWVTGMLVLVTLTLVLGVYPGGSGPGLWLGCCGVYFQPSELLKLLLIAYLAAYLGDGLRGQHQLLRLLQPTLLVVGATLLVLVLQRDLGTATLFILLYALIVYLATGRRSVILLSVGAMAAAALAGYYFFGVIQARVNTWLNPWGDPAGTSYQIIQSLMAIAAGGAMGTGPGLGSPGLVPVAISDFVFAAIIEETGWLGAIGLLLLIGLMLTRGLRAALQAGSTYARLLAAGISVYFCVQSVLILAGNLSLAPLTGITLPFVSYGGSSMLTAFIMLLLLIRISGENEGDPLPIHAPRPYLLTAGAMLVALAVVAGGVIWWNVFQADALFTRNDNFRRSIADRYVERGALLDRNNNTLAMSEGERGNFQRNVLYPDLSATLGYTHPSFGQSGLEASQDDYLRGLRGNPASDIWLTQLLYNHPPQGLDVRLSLDVSIQREADALMEGLTGALVLMNAETGEILALSTTPTFDANQMDELEESWSDDERAPLVNRVTQGLYPPGAALGPFFLAARLGQNPILSDTPPTDYYAAGQRYACAEMVGLDASWGEAIASGCPAAGIALFENADLEAMQVLYERLGLLQAPDFDLVMAGPQPPEANASAAEIITAQDGMKVTPLQMALAAAALTNDGKRPGPRLAMSVLTPHQGWVALPVVAAEQALPTSGASAAVTKLKISEMPAWETVAVVKGTSQEVTWYLAGTTPTWQGVPLTVVVLLEENNAARAVEIGQSLLLAVMEGK